MPISDRNTCKQYYSSLSLWFYADFFSNQVKISLGPLHNGKPDEFRNVNRNRNDRTKQLSRISNQVQENKSETNIFWKRKSDDSGEFKTQLVSTPSIKKRLLYNKLPKLTSVIGDLVILFVLKWVFIFLLGLGELVKCSCDLDTCTFSTVFNLHLCIDYVAIGSTTRLNSSKSGLTLCSTMLNFPNISWT